MAVPPIVAAPRPRRAIQLVFNHLTRILHLAAAMPLPARYESGSFRFDICDLRNLSARAETDGHARRRLE